MPKRFLYQAMTELGLSARDTVRFLKWGVPLPTLTKGAYKDRTYNLKQYNTEVWIGVCGNERPKSKKKSEIQN